MGFAPGNLQAVIGSGPDGTEYNYTVSSWKFANKQYEYIGNAAGNTTFAVGSTVDLFSWVGSSASYDSYGLCTSVETNSVYYGFSASDALKTDWGSIKGVVSSLGHGWYTLSSSEWEYLRTQRTNASSLFGYCDITTDFGTVAGLFLLPDNWMKPDNCTVIPGEPEYDEDWNPIRVTYSASAASGALNAWCDMESRGAVFLPPSGQRYGLFTVYYDGTRGYYWSSSSRSENEAECYVVYSPFFAAVDRSRYNGCSVRLVRDVE